MVFTYKDKRPIQGNARSKRRIYDLLRDRKEEGVWGACANEGGRVVGKLQIHETLGACLPYRSQMGGKPARV